MQKANFEHDDYEEDDQQCIPNELTNSKTIFISKTLTTEDDSNDESTSSDIYESMLSNELNVKNYTNHMEASEDDRSEYIPLGRKIDIVDIPSHMKSKTSYNLYYNNENSSEESISLSTKNNLSLADNNLNHEIVTSNNFEFEPSSEQNFPKKVTQVDKLEDESSKENINTFLVQESIHERNNHNANKTREEDNFGDDNNVQNEKPKREDKAVETRGVEGFNSQSRPNIDTHLSNEENEIIQRSLLAAKMFMLINVSKFFPEKSKFQNATNQADILIDDQTPNVIVQTKIESMSTLRSSSYFNSSRGSIGVELNSAVSNEDVPLQYSVSEVPLKTDIECNSILPRTNQESNKSTFPVNVGEANLCTITSLVSPNSLTLDEFNSKKSCKSTGSLSTSHHWETLQKDTQKGGVSNERKSQQCSRFTLPTLLVLFVAACVLTFSSIFQNNKLNDSRLTGENANKNSFNTSAPSLYPTSYKLSVSANAPSKESSTDTTSSNSLKNALSGTPSAVQSDHPSASLSKIPSLPPSKIPSASPSNIPSLPPSMIPSASPSKIPTAYPSKIPSAFPSKIPTDTLSSKPTNTPSRLLSSSPSFFQTKTFSDFSFYVMGDIPYNDYQKGLLKGQLNDISSLQASGGDSSDFIVHVGDLMESQEKCLETAYQSVNKIFKTKSTLPILTVPGDNDWNDCGNPVQAWKYFDKHFIGLEHEWNNSPIASMVERSSTRPENFAFLKSGVLFLGINMVAGSAEKSHRSQRIIDNEEWVHANLDKYEDEIRAVIIFGHSTVGTKIFGSIKQKVQPLEIPLIYINGNSHYHMLSRELNFVTAPPMWDKFWRLQLDAGAFAPPMKITIRGNDEKTNIHEFRKVTEYQTVIANDLIKLDRRQLVSYFVKWS